MFKALTKLSIAGSAISGVVLIDLKPKAIPAKGEELLLEEIKSSTKEFGSVADVLMYEKANGCSFVFSNSKKLEDLYTTEEFWNKIKDEGKKTTLSEESIFKWANTGKKYCDGKVVTIFREDDNTLNLGAPEGGWGA